MRALVVVVVLLVPVLAHADASSSLRDGNAAATQNDWATVSSLVDPLFAQQLGKADLAEAHRLAGLAAFFAQPPRYPDAELHFFEYMKLDLDGQLDPSAYPPEVIGFFANVRQKHWAELRALRPKPKGSIWLSFLPPAGQFQNGDRVKGIVVGSALGAFAIANVASFLVLRNWCTKVAGSTGGSATCDDEQSNHYRSADRLRTFNIVTGIGLIATYIYGVYDGYSGYRRRTREMQMVPFFTQGTVGVSLAW